MVKFNTDKESGYFRHNDLGWYFTYSRCGRYSLENIFDQVHNWAIWDWDLDKYIFRGTNRECRAWIKPSGINK